jgi:hypothetical protein
MHPKLLVDVIKRQAGSIQKAILEGVMNSIEAEASMVIVDISNRKITIEDDGKGFRSMEEIEAFFETFGQPHDASENKVWAQFRMGRGQMFAFGKNHWRTGNYEMTVDINSMAETTLGYDLRQTKEFHKGCHIQIDLYDPLSDRDVNECKRELERSVAYVKCPVLVNGVDVSQNPDKCKWDDDSNEDAYIKISTSDFKGLSIYNLGVLVCEIRRHEIGVGGTVVSKKRLDVNFARNDIIRSDPTWKRIKQTIENAAGLQTVKEKRTLTPAEREAMILAFLDGDKSIEIWKMRLIEDTNGKSYSMNMVHKFRKFTIAPKWDRVADKVMQQGIALCVNVENAELFSPRKPENMFKVIYKLTNCDREGLEYVPYEELAKGINNKHYLVPSEKLLLEDRLWMEFCQTVVTHYNYSHYLHSETKMDERKIVIGESQTAEAWTDGSTYVALDRGSLPKFRDQRKGCVDIQSVAKVAILLAHEFAHIDERSDRDHVHDDEFYKRFHDTVERWVDVAVGRATVTTPKALDVMVKRNTKGKKAPTEVETSVETEAVAKEG